MDRRVVAGIVGLALAGAPQAAPAQQVGPDPSGLPPVGLAPIPSLGDTINGASGYPGRAAYPSTNVPTNPASSGPPAALPNTPSSPGPVSMTPEPPITESLRSGYSTVRPGAIYRGVRAMPSRSPAPNAPRFAAPGPRPAAAQAPRVSAPVPLPDPPALPELPPDNPPAATGRPAPYQGQSPDLARPQAAAPSPTAGRPAPVGNAPAVARPPAPSEAVVPSYQPANIPAPGPSPTPPPIQDPAPEPIPAPAPVPDPIPPALDPAIPQPPPVGQTPPPIGTDPLQAIVAPALPFGPGAPPSDPAVTRAGADSTALKMKADPTARDLPFATRRAAAVGDEVITFEEMNAVVLQRLEEVKGAAPESEAEKRQFINAIAAQALDHMIDQAVILQEAKRRMRNPKAQSMFNDFVDKSWREDELPTLLRRTATTNEYELKRKLTEQGKSYDVMKEAFRKKLLARDFLGAEIRNKVSCDLAEQRAYYNDHIANYEQPARFTWREFEVSIAKYPDRVAARKAAEAVLARLLRNEDFDVLARASSDGPTASRGGLYPDMSPGSYGIPVVNDELNRLPVGQLSAILEAPNSFHIVRVESRREAGPLRFDEVQDKIKPVVMERNYQRAVENYLAKLRSRTLIRTMFDNTESDPGRAKRNDASVRPVSN